MTEQSYPIEKIREEFPAMQRIGNSYFVGYFDSPGGTQITKSVIEAISNYMKNGVANDGGESCTSKETENIVTQAREAIATLLGTEQQNIVFGENMTSLTFRIARTLQRMWRDSSGNIVITEMDHHANRDSWASAVEDLPLNVHSIPINPITKTLDTNHLEHIITNDTKLVAIGLASNAIGTINNIIPIIRRAKEVGSLIALDGVHAVPHFSVNFDDLGADFLFCSAYKFFGPHIGIVAIKRETFEDLTPHKLEPAPNFPPEKLETGTINFEALAGVKDTVEFIASIGNGNLLREKLNSAFKKISQYEEKLANRLRHAHKQMNHIKNEDVRKTPTIAFKVTGMHSKNVCHYLATHYSLYLEYGHFYAQCLVEKLAANKDGGLVRAGISLYNTEEEIDRIIQALARLK